MVKKLYKYEFLSFSKVLLPIYIVLLGTGLLNRLIQIFEAKTSAYDTVFISSIVLMGIAFFAALLMTVIYAIVRFYKNLFCAEGYLSFSLPVTTFQHIRVKAITALVSILIVILGGLLSIGIATSGEPLVEVFKAIAYIWKDRCKQIGLNTMGYSIEVLAIIVSYILYLLSFLYLCLAIGQLANKGKIGLSIGVFMGFYFAGQVTGTAIILWMSSAGFERIEAWVEKIYTMYPIEATHTVLIGLLVIQLVLITINALITNNILKKHLNLE